MQRVDLTDFEQLGALYGPFWPQSLDPFHDPWDSLALFLGGYAYERQGAPRIYSQAAVDVIRGQQGEGRALTDPGLGRCVWDQYVELLEFLAQLRANPRNNPLATSEVARQMSVVEYAADLARDGGSTLAGRSRAALQSGSTREIHTQLTGINGVGTKIASFWLRDIALVSRLAGDTDGELLQPIDVWVQRAAEISIGAADDQAGAIVEASRRARVNHMRVNAGMWYIGARVALSEYRLGQALSNRSLFWSLVADHLRVLQGAVRAYEALKSGPSSPWRAETPADPRR
ncbi:MAG TPA: hypothetical protein VFB58_01255 [Chloroflexota bacterium]|nr:hypothetical protein [Chloroflexota bacterium]